MGTRALPVPGFQRSLKILPCQSRHGLAKAVLTASAALLASQLLYGQSETKPIEPEWQRVAGGKMAFEVASLRLGEPGTFLRPNMALNNEDTPVPPGGRLFADFPIQIYIEFAYKIMPTHEQEEAMLVHLPKWVSTDRFVIQAQAEGNPTKDQIRLMMQSLLADRFKLAVHFETREVPVLAMVPDRPPILGPRLRHHEDGPACGTKLAIPADRTSSSVIPGGFIPSCGLVQAIDGPDHSVWLAGAT